MPHKSLKICCQKHNAHKIGVFRRSSDGRYIQRYRCKSCGKSFSQARFDPAYYQKKRHLNFSLMMLLSSAVSMRRSALILNLSRKTVARKLIYLAKQARQKLEKERTSFAHIEAIQFDELQTIEHTTCKPLAVGVIVSEKTRKILGFDVAKMPATGHLAAISRKKYGKRPDQRYQSMKALFANLSVYLPSNIAIISDQCSFYNSIVSEHFPKARYLQVKGKKGSIYAQGELKKTAYDPLFYINHSLAMLRANINRLIRKSWCTTKKIPRLLDHLAIYVWIHNSRLTPQAH